MPGPSPASPAYFSPAGTSSCGSATVDVGNALDPARGSVSVDQPRRRRSWGPLPSDEGPQRTLSAHSLSSVHAAEAFPGAEAAVRAHSSLGLTCVPAAPGSEEIWGIHGHRPAPAAPGGADGGCSSGPALSRRLSFSVGGFGGFVIAKTQQVMPQVL